MLTLEHVVMVHGLDTELHQAFTAMHSVLDAAPKIIPCSVDELVLEARVPLALPCQQRRTHKVAGLEMHKVLEQVHIVAHRHVHEHLGRVLKHCHRNVTTTNALLVLQNCMLKLPSSYHQCLTSVEV